MENYNKSENLSNYKNLIIEKVENKIQVYKMAGKEIPKGLLNAIENLKKVDVAEIEKDKGKLSFYGSLTNYSVNKTNIDDLLGSYLF